MPTATQWKPNGQILLGSQATRPGFLLSQDPSWKYLFETHSGGKDKLPADAINYLYLDGAGGRFDDGDYDLDAGLAVASRPDFTAYLDDFRNCVETFVAKFGEGRLLCGRGGPHNMAAWMKAARGGQLAYRIWNCLRPFWDSDSPPTSTRPPRLLPGIKALVADGVGGVMPGTDRDLVISTEDAMRPKESPCLIGAESRPNPGSSWTRADRLTVSQVSQDDTARITHISYWQQLKRQGMDDHSILMSDPVSVNEPYFAQWDELGFHINWPIDAFKAGVVPPTLL